MVDDRGRAPLRPRRPGQYGPRPLARPQPAHLSRDRQDDGEVRRGRRAAAGRGRGVPDAGRVRVDERRGAGACGAESGLAWKMTLDLGLLLRCPYRLWSTRNVRNTSRARRGVATTTIFVTVS